MINALVSIFHQLPFFFFLVFLGRSGTQDLISQIAGQTFAGPSDDITPKKIDMWS